MFFYDNVSPWTKHRYFSHSQRFAKHESLTHSILQRQNNINLHEFSSLLLTLRSSRGRKLRLQLDNSLKYQGFVSRLEGALTLSLDEIKMHVKHLLHYVLSNEVTQKVVRLRSPKLGFRIHLDWIEDMWLTMQSSNLLRSEVASVAAALAKSFQMIINKATDTRYINKLLLGS